MQRGLVHAAGAPPEPDPVIGIVDQNPSAGDVQCRWGISPDHAAIDARERVELVIGRTAVSSRNQYQIAIWVGGSEGGVCIRVQLHTDLGLDRTAQRRTSITGPERRARRRVERVGFSSLISDQDVIAGLALEGDYRKSPLSRSREDPGSPALLSIQGHGTGGQVRGDAIGVAGAVGGGVQLGDLLDQRRKTNAVTVHWRP